MKMEEEVRERRRSRRGNEEQGKKKQLAGPVPQTPTVTSMTTSKLIDTVSLNFMSRFGRALLNDCIIHRLSVSEPACVSVKWWW